MSSHFSKLFLGTSLLALCVAPEICNAQTTRLIPFDEFYRTVSTAQSAVYVGAQRAADVGAFNEMRQHILSLYKGVSVKHSFLFDQGTYDCVPVTQQPALNGTGVTSVEAAPELPLADDPLEDAENATQSDPAQPKDALGNVTDCADGTIPMRRVTLDDIARFGTLQQFFKKGPDGAGQVSPGAPAKPQLNYTHKYAHSYEFVPNLGGTTTINLWNVVVNTQENEIFSLAQYWYVNTASTLQTLENGVQDYPQMYRTTKPVLFIYWTADAYNRTGCYNLTCKAFVQTNSHVKLGGSFAHYSVQGGKQYQVILRAHKIGTRWWIYFNGGKPANAIGYYPTSIYQGGTMSRNANEIDYGGEVVGATIWPPMGSGKFPATGPTHAAYYKNISYFALNNAVFQGKLTVSQPSPACFGDRTSNKSGTAAGTYFYFGGPGGTRC